ncbi:unnamed protein product [Rotaria sordida]|uniref:Uncharacterized protein n=1 Tax=Rotaria sordida TaxID=392033 RepID=A0A819F0C5_9BILA|nr:unnamed protein product [Rotaria sordida]CAF1234842.1 unnamed protein product [Rotaria sordida]CAF1356198.1 unnamed protein product [Rotaria sordida]CAF1365311.1 unnamed protein product [Rotaria sordida]CAF1524023.1 unnamed protein product [Rotaria sordida]
MNTTIILTGILAYFLLMLTMTYSFALSSKTTDDENHELIEGPLILSPYKFNSIYENDGSIFDDSDEHELGKRRFNAWAGKRSLASKGRFNAWAGRR